MKLLNMSIKGLKLFEDGLEIDFIARQRITENNKNGLTKLIGNIYKQNLLSIIGINASGKTTALKWVSFLLDIYLMEGKINDIKYESLLNSQHIFIEAYFLSDSNLLKINSEIIQDENGEYVFKEERLWKKRAVKSISKNNLLEFNDNQIVIVRSKQQSLFLSNKMSIMISQNKNKVSKPMVMDLLTDTNFNVMRVLGDVPTQVIQYLDESVEYVKNELTTKEHIRLKFKNQEKEFLIYNPLELYNYLSSGTIRGLNVFAGINNVLKSGGFLIIDEIENHFNQTIVKTIIEMFKHEKINVTGATLIFTTHYSELLDVFDRNDSIYITFKEYTLRLRNLNDLLKRSDFKKSEVYQSSYVGSTAPSYEAYMNLKKYFMNLGETIIQSKDYAND